MISSTTDDNRDVIPIWRDFESTTATDELRPTRIATGEKRTGDIVRLREEFQATGEEYVAADLLSALVANQADMNEIVLVATRLAEFSAKREEPGFESLLLESHGDGHRDLVHDASLSPEFLARIRIAHLRRLLREFPRDAIRRVDLALQYTILGMRPQARREMSIALRLAPQHRFVVRSASRLMIHDEDFDAAHEVLVTAGTLHSDPWVLASAMAAAELAAIPPQGMRLAREMLSSGNFTPMQLSELASEMATIELRGGSTKRAQKLFNQSLIAPNENAVAQAQWASAEGGISIGRETLAIDRGHEARARDHALKREWAGATSEGLRWLADQPFALEPAISTSYAASFGIEDYESALQAARIGLRSHPHDGTLRNNAAFALACMGKIEEAHNELAEVSALDQNESVTVLATRGLIEYRRGNPEEGRLLYRRAIQGFMDIDRPDLSDIARAYWMLEEFRANPSSGEALARLAESDYSLSASPEVQLLIHRLKSNVNMD